MAQSSVCVRRPREGARPVQRIALASLSVLAVALAAVTVSSSPPTESLATQGKPAELPARPQPQKAAVHHIKVTVSGPQDTVMRVSRAGAQTEVELRGEPFEFEFTEQLTHVGSLGITVSAISAISAISADAATEPLRCAITVDGRPVATDARTSPGEDGTARVHCMIPLDV